MALLTGLFTKLMGFLLSLILVWTVPPAYNQSFAPNEAGTLRLQLSVISDVHMESFTYNRYRIFAAALRDIARTKTQSNALVLVGDNTMNGQFYEYTMLYGLLSRYNRTNDLLVAMGNHDLNRSTYTTEEAIARHNLFYQSHTGRANGKPYYALELNGYFCIVLGDELPQEDTRATITQAQLDWLAQTMECAGQSGKPIFVFCHQPLNHTFPWSWGGLGEQSEAVRGIINKYKNVFFFSGHLHNDAVSLRIMRGLEADVGGQDVTYIDLPTLTGDPLGGAGYQVEVYDNKVLLRGRLFSAGTWLDAAQFEISLV